MNYCLYYSPQSGLLHWVETGERFNDNGIKTSNQQVQFTSISVRR